MPIVGIDHVQVAARPGCEPEARRFYRRGLSVESSFHMNSRTPGPRADQP
jgi:hypothetical protein